MAEPPLLSVVAPMHNEEATAEAFVRRTVAALEGARVEIVVVDDGSTDATEAVLGRLAAEIPALRVIALSRNFGHQAAITAGLEHARGDAVVTIDGDLQDPPEVIPELVERWEAGADVVYAVRRERRGETRFKLATARWFYRLFATLTEVELPHNSGDFRLVSRRALDALLAMPERSRFLRGMTVWIGFTQTTVSYDRDPRHGGETKFTLRRMLRFSFDAISSFSHVPLQLATLLGFLCSAVAFLGIPVAVGFRLADQYVPGVTSTIVVLLLLGGLQLITLGIIGEYLARIYDEVKGRPLYIVRGRVEPAGDAPEDAPSRSSGPGAPDGSRLTA